MFHRQKTISGRADLLVIANVLPRRAFSLIELLAVMAIIALLLVALGPAIGSIGKSQGITQASGDIPDIFAQARAYAMANNTYVYIGIKTVEDDAKDEVYFGIVAAKDGLKSKSNALLPANLAPLSRLVVFDGIHLDTSAATEHISDDGFRTAFSSGDEVTASSISFPSSVVSNDSDISSFDAVAQFAPSGAANLSATAESIPGYISMGFVPAKGKADNSFAVLLDGPSGAARVARNSLSRD